MSTQQRSYYQSEWGQFLLDVVFPPRCAGCRAWGALGICGPCERRLQRVGEPLCRCCGFVLDENHQKIRGTLCFDCAREIPAFDAARSPFGFEGALREAIHRLKYGGETALARPLAQMLCDWWIESGERSARIAPFLPDDIEAIVPVPLHWGRKWRRGYNQSEILAREVGKILGLPVVPALRRVRYTVSQVRLNEDERAKNVRGAFATNEKVSISSTVLIVDDVYTTGATLNECARVLKSAGAQRVFALTLARQL